MKTTLLFVCSCFVLVIVTEAQTKLDDTLIKVLMSPGDDIHRYVNEAVEIASAHGTELSPWEARLLCRQLYRFLGIRQCRETNPDLMEESWAKLHFICDKLERVNEL